MIGDAAGGQNSVWAYRYRPSLRDQPRCPGPYDPHKIEPPSIEASLQSHGECTYFRPPTILVKGCKDSTGCRDGKDFRASES